MDNYLLTWCENQACWHAGIHLEDLNQPNPPVYDNHEDGMYQWAPFGDPVQSFILTTILEQYSFRGEAINDPEEIQRTPKEGGVDFQRLQESYPFPGGRFAHTCPDTDTNTLCVYGERAEGHPAYLRVIQPE
ncbi:MAG: hypothetical protein HFJ80_02770 [Clostridiales bacterium]|nr:hypothetical protein [Clostridiales bacterium]